MNVLIKRLLINFYKATQGRKPERLILYRDGVSEGMFNEVQRAEIPQILQACRCPLLLYLSREHVKVPRLY